MTAIAQRAIRWAAVMVALFMTGIAYCFWLLSGPNPADHFEVLRVVTDSQTQRHAVVYRYDHSNSSTRPIAVWIVSGKAPNIGSKDPVRGAPTLVWTGSADALKLEWPPPDGKSTCQKHSMVSDNREVVKLC
jgi:hypothetical protein